MVTGERSGSAGNWILNALLLAVGIVTLTYAFRLGLGTASQPGAGLFPFLAGVTILIADVALIAGCLRDGTAAPEFPLERGDPGRLVALVSVMCAWMLAMPYLGYVVMTFAGTCALARVYGLGGWRRPLMLAALTSLTVYGLFDWLLFLDLPRGIFAPGD